MMNDEVGPYLGAIKLVLLAGLWAGASRNGLMAWGHYWALEAGMEWSI